MVCRVGAILWVLWGERNRRVFRNLEREPLDVLSLLCFHVSLWASILKDFCNYPIDTLLHSWNLFL